MPTRFCLGGRIALRAGRGLLWAVLVVWAGVLVRGEADRPRLPEGVEVRTGIVYRDSGGRRLALDLYRPRGPVPPGGWPTVVAIHGGGWRGGSRGDFGPTVARLAQHGVAVAAIDYTLSRPGAPSWPENRDDVRAAVRWLRKNAARQGLDPGRLAALGASAGGHLALLLGLDPGADGARVQAVVSLYGPTDLASLDGACLQPGGPVDLLLGGTPAEQPARAVIASPVTHVTAGAPPVLLIHGIDDSLVPVAQSERLAAVLERVGVACRLVALEGEAHGFGLEVAERDLLPELLAFLDNAWNDKDEAG